MSIDTEKTSHPSFGYMRLNRVSSTAHRLFMSDLRHQNFITLEIGHAELHRSLHGDRHSAEKEVIEIEMSEMQLGQLLSSMNSGSGVPCTLAHIQGERMPEVPRNPWMEKFHSEVRADFDEIRDQITVLKNRMQAAVDSSKPMGQKEKIALLDMLKSVEQHVGSNIPFVMTQFQEKMEDVVSQAKSEIGAYVQQRLALQPGEEPPFTLSLPEGKDR